MTNKLIATFCGGLFIAIALSAFSKDEQAPADKVVHAGEPRSPQWPALERKWIKAHGECSVCKSKEGLQVHHLVPFHDHPELELDETNLVTLCGPKGRNCHLYWGHLGDYRCYNHNLKKWLKDVKDRKEE